MSTLGYRSHKSQLAAANITEVSRATVSIVVNGEAVARILISEETHQRVKKAIDEPGCEPDSRARSLRLEIQ